MGGFDFVVPCLLEVLWIGGSGYRFVLMWDMLPSAKLCISKAVVFDKEKNSILSKKNFFF